MAQNSTSANGEMDSSITQLILNTTKLSDQDMTNYLSLCEEVERLRLSKHNRPSYTESIKATMTREEIFECSTLTDEEFLSALEHQNSHLAAKPIDNMDISQSMVDMLKYFEKDISLSSKSNRSTPTNFSTNGKVAAVVASFAKKNQPEVSRVINQPRRSITPPLFGIKALRAKYEAQIEPKSTKVGKVQTSSVLKTPARISVTKLKSVSQLAQFTKSPKASRKSKVKQIAHMFNMKFSQTVHRNSRDVKNYVPLNNEYSPEQKSQALLNCITTASTPPIPKPRKKAPETRSAVQSLKPPKYCIPRPSPRPSPNLRRRPSIKSQSDNTLVAEDAFSQLSVKDKVLLFTTFIDDMSQKNPKFSKHAEVLKSNVHEQLALGEVVNEKQESVKHLTQELEAKCTFPKQRISPKALLRMQSANDVTYVAQKVADPQLYDSIEEGSVSFRTECTQVDEDEESELLEEDAQYTSTLTVVLRSNLNGKDNGSQTVRPKTLTRCKRNERLLQHLNIFEPSQKRNNDSIRSLHLSTELYAPPKKIRRTLSERLNLQQFFQNTDLEELFIAWMQERNGVDFDIAYSDNMRKLVKLVQAERKKSIASVGSDATQNSTVECLLEEAVTKLEKNPTTTSVDSDATQNSNVECMLEEAATKLKNPITTSNNSEDAKTIEEINNCPVIMEEICTVPPPLATKVNEINKKPRRKRKAPAPPVPTQQPAIVASEEPSDIQCDSDHSTSQKVPAIVPPVPAPRNIRVVSNNIAGCAVSSSKQSDIESVPDISTIPKLQSGDESQPEQQQDVPKSTTSCEIELIKPPRMNKKQLLPSEDSEPSTSTAAGSIGVEVIATTCSDSESDSTQKIQKKSLSPTKSTEHGNNIKNFCLKTLKAITSPKQTKEMKINAEQPLDELNEESLSVDGSHPIPPVVDVTEENSTATKADESASVVNHTNMQTKQQNDCPLSDNYVDQGFETGTNSSGSPVQRWSPLFFNLNESPRLSLYRRSSYGLRGLYNASNRGSPSNYSTPVKGYTQKSFVSSAHAQQQEVSPIQRTSNPSSRRRSAYDAEMYRNSLIMEVIREDQTYNPNDRPTSTTPDSPNISENAFFANAPTMDMSSNVDFETEKPFSTFWVVAGDYTVAIKIFYNTLERLHLLYDVFSQKNVNDKLLHFGIDDHKFTPNDPKNNYEPISRRLPPKKDSSHYWFSTGDIAVPFNGKYMPGTKVRRLFNFIYSCLEPEVKLRFGVDGIEFTHPRDRVSPFDDKFSMGSNYHMLIGLHSGDSNGLEGRSKYAWPNSMSNTLNANNVKISDLDESDMETISLRSAEILRQSRSLSSTLPSCSSSPLQGEDMSSSDISNPIYENDFLAQIYKDAEQYNLNQAQVDKVSSEKSITFPELLGVLQNQQQKLKLVEQRLSAYVECARFSNVTFQQFKDSPEYMRKLKHILKIIDNVELDSGFRNCSPQQLERFIFFLNRYADICVARCSSQMNRLLDALMEHSSVDD